MTVRGYGLVCGGGQRSRVVGRVSGLVRIAACLVALPLVLVVLAVVPGVASAESLCTDTWVGSAEGYWQTGANWSTGHMPTSADVACIGAGKTAIVSEGSDYASVVQGQGSVSVTGGVLEVSNALEPSSINAVTLSAGTIRGAATLKITKTFTWIGGTMGPGGVTVIPSGATAKIPGTTSVEYISERNLQNNGVFRMEASAIVLGNNAEITNNGTFYANDNLGGCHFCEYGSGIDRNKGGAEGAKVINRGLLERTADEEREVLWITPDFYNYGRVPEVVGHLHFERPVNTSRRTQYGGAGTVKCADPVNCLTGDFTETETDLSVEGRGIGLNVTRTYNAQAAAAGEHSSFGYGWSGLYSMHVVAEGSAHTATVVQGDGSTLTFNEEGSVWAPPTGSLDKLTGNSTEGYTLTLPDQTKYAFNSTGRLESIADRNGNTTTLTYNEKGQLSTITDPAGRKLTLAYNSEGLVENGTDPMGHVFRYTYENGNLVSVTPPGATSPRWRYKYDASHQMTGLIDGRGNEATNTYDSENRVITQKDMAGHTWKWVYEPFGTKVTNEATGSVTLYEFTSEYRLTGVTRGYGTGQATTEALTYNEASELIEQTDGNGYTTTYEYDGAGNKIKQVDPESHETKWTYNSAHDVLTETKPNGEKTTIARDEHGNPTVISRPAPGSTTQETKLEYNTHGQLTSMTDPLGRKWSYEYDSQGDRTSETDPEGDKRTWAYNEDSQETSSVSPRGNAEGGKPAEYTTTIERDQQGRPLKITDPLGHETRYGYDPDGNKTSEVDPNGHETKTTFNTNNQPVKITEPNGTITETGYDGAGQIISQTDGNKHTTNYKRNVLEQVTEITDPLLRKTTKTYDAAGNLATVTDPQSRTTTFTRDKDNRITKIAYSDGVTPTVEYEFDANGNRSSMTDGSGKTVYTHDQLDRLTKVTDGHGDTVGYEYDLADQQTKITYPNGKIVERSFDKAGRLTSVKDWLTNTIGFAYDPNSNMTAIAFPESTSENDRYAYDRADRQTEATIRKGEETLASLAYTRDPNGQVTKTISKGLPGAETNEYEYDENERLTKAGALGYAYDAANNPTMLPGSTNTFDAANELTEGTNLKYSYDKEGERTKTTPTSGPAIAYAYNQAGNLTSVSRPAEGETSKIEDSYAYNGDGLRASQTINGTTAYWTWGIAQPGEPPALLSDGTNNYIYGPTGPVEQIGAKEKPLYLHHDQQGSTRLLTDSTGTVEGAYSYTPYGGTEAHTGAATTPLGYDGQLTSSDTGLIYLRARAYDPVTAQFMSVDPMLPTTGTPYTYGSDNPLNISDPSGLCNANPFSESFWTQGNCISESSLNPIPYYEKEIESYEDGCGYFASVAFGFEGAVVGAASLIPLDDAELRLSAWLQAKFPWLSEKVIDWVARDNAAKYGQPGWQEFIKKVVEHIAR